MINQSNIKEVLISMGFHKEKIGNFFKKDFGAFNMSVDIDNKTLNYPQGVVLNDKTTSNFSHDENFVVFECVNRLMEKGYLPETIELEPRWRLGHDSKSSGKPDILIKDKNGDNLIIIECKTAGKEYRKEKKNTETDGGQLFSYWQQDNGIKWLALYASDWDGTKITYQSDIINCTDDANILKMSERDKDVKVFAHAKNDSERFEVWRDTYNCQWLSDLIFSEDSQPYQIELKPLRKKDLKDFTPDDKIVNQFEEILRHNNVSDKENAFNRLVALFICKLVDEIKKQDYEEVDFQYKYTDTYETLQDRLQRLHQQGMEEFMKEKIFYVDDGYAERLFENYTGQKRKAAIEDLKHTIRVLKFYSNNDFAFKDVHNEELFYQNGKILVEVVQLFQPYRIVYQSKHQFLGDLFEQLLNKGFKQNEGQFFTPTPITRFIWDALPLSNYISEHDLPRIIDYACGAGHFLTEGVEAVNAIRPNEENNWVEKHIYGVEKDYRLARVSKVSMFMNGAGGSNIIFGDGLENYLEKGIEPHSFDILVANPPYSVNGFKRHLSLHNNEFSILKQITLEGKEIETLFVERIAQLLKPQGIAAVVLPASILSNASASYTAARGELLQNFRLHAIVAFGSKTFGATSTNTVTLFLEKYEEPPRKAEMVKDFVTVVMGNDFCDGWKDKVLFDEYLKHQHIGQDIYRRFVSKELNWEELAADSYLKTYYDAFRTQAISIPKSITTAEEKEKYRRDKFYDMALATEKRKLYYFALTSGQHTLVVTAPADNKAQKEFLGYDWSNRKGDEGIKIIKPGGMLYNDDDRFARGTIACAIRNSFIDAQTQLPEEFQQFAKWYRLTDMVKFSSTSFNIEIGTTLERVANPYSNFNTVRLGSVVKIIRGITYPNEAEVNYPTNNIILPADNITTNGKLKIKKPIFLKDANFLEEEKKLHKGDIFMCFSSGSKKHVGKSCFIEKNTEYYAGGFMGILRINNSIIDNHFLAYLLNSSGFKALLSDYSKGSNINNLSNKIGEIELPLPPMSTQQQIVTECEAEDRKYDECNKKIESLANQKAEIVGSISANEVTTIEALCDEINPSRSEISNMPDDTSVSFVEMNSLGQGIIEKMVDRPLGELRKGGYTYFAENDILIAKITPCMENGKCAIASGLTNGIGMGSTEFHVLRVNKSKVMPEYVFALLNQDKIRKEAAAHFTGSSGHRRVPIDYYKHLEIPFLPLQEQNRIVKQIYGIDQQVIALKVRRQECAANKQAILDKYLK